MGDLSEHFSRAEFRCRGANEQNHRDHPTIVKPELVEALERLRQLREGLALRIVSGYRCSMWNRTVGGARYSQHLYGSAADIPAGYCTVEQAAAAGFRGIGNQGQWAIHVDVRRTPARWSY